MTKKHLFTGTLLSAAIALAGCQNTPSSEYEQTLAAQKQSFEQQIQQLQADKKAAEKRAAFHAQQAKEAQSQSRSNTVANGLFPPNAKPGHCYSRVLIPATYKSMTEKVLVKPATENLSILPAKYEDASERVLVAEASKKIVAVPATYKTVTERVMVRPAHTHLKTVPAVYGTVTEKVLDKPAHTVWKRGAGFQSSALETRIDNGTGEIMCLVEVPATYKTITKTVVKTPARTVEEKHPAEYKTVTKRVVDQPATTKTVTIPAQYKTVAVKRLVSAEKEVRKSIPAVYKNVTSTKKVSAEELKWAEVLCEDNMTSQTVSRLQTLLKKANAYAGPIDGIYGPQTERAVNSYAKKNNLPTGSRLVSLETAKHIGL